MNLLANPPSLEPSVIEMTQMGSPSLLSGWTVHFVSHTLKDISNVNKPFTNLEHRHSSRHCSTCDWQHRNRWWAAALRSLLVTIIGCVRRWTGVQVDGWWFCTLEVKPWQPLFDEHPKVQHLVVAYRAAISKPRLACAAIHVVSRARTVVDDFSSWDLVTQDLWQSEQYMSNHWGSSRCRQISYN